MRMFFLYLLHLQANNNASFKGLFPNLPQHLQFVNQMVILYCKYNRFESTLILKQVLLELMAQYILRLYKHAYFHQRFHQLR